MKTRTVQTNNVQKNDIWGTSAADALRVPTLSADIRHGRAVSKWNLTDDELRKAARGNLYSESIPTIDCVLNTDFVLDADLDLDAIVTSRQEVSPPAPLGFSRARAEVGLEQSKYACSESNPYEVGPADVHSSVTSTIEPAHSVPAAGSTIIGVYSATEDYLESLSKHAAQHHAQIEFISYAQLSSGHFKLTGAEVSAWIIDLSDEHDDPVLEALLENSADIATLFLFEPMLTEKGAQKVDCFMRENNLV